VKAEKPDPGKVDHGFHDASCRDQPHRNFLRSRRDRAVLAFLVAVSMAALKHFPARTVRAVE
jgi:hypothetical protein